MVSATVFGVATGAPAVMTLCTKLCRREETEQLYEQMTLKSAWPEMTLILKPQVKVFSFG